MKKIVAILAALGLLLVLTGTVGAQDDSRPTDSQQQAGRGHRPLRELVDIVAAETGLEPREIAQQMRDGTTLAEIIAANGGDTQSVIDQAVATITDHVNQAVADGKLQQERADEILANLTEKVTQGINGELGSNRAVERRAGMAVLRLAAEQTGMTVRDIVDEIRSGKSLADVLTAKGIETESFITDAVTTFNQRLDQAVTNGRLTQEEADAKIVTFEQKLRERITQPGGMEIPATATAST